jgi:thiol-disulfide isomerase/thioredoxin
LAELSEPVLLQVFVTPTCPYCPQAVITAHQMAMESPYVEAEMVEATEFPELSNQYQIMGVPDMVINQGKGKIVGAVPEGRLMIEIKNILAKTGKSEPGWVPVFKRVTIPIISWGTIS